MDLLKTDNTENWSAAFIIPLQIDTSRLWAQNILAGNIYYQIPPIQSFNFVRHISFSLLWNDFRTGLHFIMHAEWLLNI